MAPWTRWTSGSSGARASASAIRPSASSSSWRSASASARAARARTSAGASSWARRATSTASSAWPLQSSAVASTVSASAESGASATARRARDTRVVETMRAEQRPGRRERGRRRGGVQVGGTIERRAGLVPARRRHRLVRAAHLKCRGLADRGWSVGRGSLGQDDRRREHSAPDWLEQPGGLHDDEDQQDGEHGRPAHAASTIGRATIRVRAERDDSEGRVRRACHNGDSSTHQNHFHSGNTPRRTDEQRQDARTDEVGPTDPTLPRARTGGGYPGALGHAKFQTKSPAAYTGQHDATSLHGSARWQFCQPCREIGSVRASAEKEVSIRRSRDELRAPRSRSRQPAERAGVGGERRRGRRRRRGQSHSGRHRLVGSSGGWRG